MKVFLVIIFTFILAHSFCHPNDKRTFLARFREILQNIPTLGGQSVAAFKFHEY